MGKEVQAGAIIAKFIIETNQMTKGINSGLKGFNSLIKRASLVASRVGGSMKTMGESIKREAADIGDIADRMTMVGAALTAPLALAFNSFANSAEKVKKKITEIDTQRKALLEKRQGGNLSLFETGQIDLQINLLNQQEAALIRNNKAAIEAAQTKQKLVDAFDKVKLAIGSLVKDAIEPYIPKLLSMVEKGQLWVKNNKETAVWIVKTVGALGLFFITAGPVLSVVIKLVEMFGLLVMTGGNVLRLFGLLGQGIAAIGGVSTILPLLVFFGLLWALFKDQLNPILEKHKEKIQEIWDKWKEGDLTIKEVTDKMLKVLKDFAKEAALAMAISFSEWFADKIGKDLQEVFNKMWDGAEKSLRESGNSIFKTIGVIWEEGFADLSNKVEGWLHGVKDSLNSVVDSFNFAADGVLKALGKIKKAWDDAFIHSWFIDGMENMAAASIMGAGTMERAFSRSAKSLQGSLAGMGGSLNVSTTANIGAAVSTNELIAELRKAVDDSTHRYVDRLTRRL